MLKHQAYGDNFTMRVESDTVVNDILIVMFEAGSEYSTSGPRRIERDESTGVRQTWVGSIAWSRNHANIPISGAHEIGHVLDQIYIWKDRDPEIARYINETNHTFTGPEAMRENGGTPVPFRLKNKDNETVYAGDPGATPDYGHIGVCTSVMSYCRPAGRNGPQPIDFAILNDSGYTLIDARTAAENEVYGFGHGEPTALGAQGLNETYNMGTTSTARGQAQTPSEPNPTWGFATATLASKAKQAGRGTSSGSIGEVQIWRR